MNIENVKMIFGCPDMASEKKSNSSLFVPIVISLIAIVYISIYVDEKRMNIKKHER